MNDAMLPQNDQDLPVAIATVPPGRWGVGVSGGADSVALLLLLRDRTDLQLHVIHLDHETREGESAADAKFVADFARRLNLQATIAVRSAIEANLPVGSIPTNLSVRYRLARMVLFRQVIVAENLQGVVLAHHAGDQAETILQRILRGAGSANLAGIKPISVVDGLTILHPLLDVHPSRLRDFLAKHNQDWREDSSNQSGDYLRNRLRQWLGDHPALRGHLLRVGAESAKLRDWLDQSSPQLGERFSVRQLADLPLPTARHAAARWLIERGVPVDQINSGTTDRLIEMTSDAASPSRCDFPGSLHVRRARGEITASSPHPAGHTQTK